jgi:uncharacterized cupredoxin-like copper-binding protein
LRLVTTIAAALLLGTAPAAAHSDRHFSAGEPGNPAKPSRTIKVSMQEKGKKMFYVPSRIVVHKGEQIRFVLFNDGIENHEFVLATVKENLELLWKFSKAGTFEYGCLIPGHHEAGMHGTIIVK